MNIKKYIMGAVASLALLSLAACTDADVASRNLSTKADQFEITRKIRFINGFTGDSMMEITGLCALGNADKSRELTVTCKIGPDKYVKHFLGLADNVTYVVEQIETSSADVYHYTFIFKPSAIIPNIRME